MGELSLWFSGLFPETFPKELAVLITSMVPLIELRGGLVVSALWQLPYWKALLICMFGNVVFIPFGLWLITPIFTWIKQHTFLKKLVEKIEARAQKQSKKIEAAEFWGLVLFVGIPLPGTGAWSGCLIASLLGIKFKKAFPAILLGVLLAAAIMSFITYGLPWLSTMFSGLMA